VGTEERFIAVFCGLGTLTAAFGAWGALEQHRRIRTWTEVPAVVLESESYVRRGSTYARIRYRYRADGADRESERLLPGPYSGGSGRDQVYLARFPAGAAVTAWHDPARPGKSFLIPFHSFVPYLIVLFSVAFFAGAAGVATRGVEVSPSGGPVARARRGADGWWEVPVFREWLAMRNASLAAATLLLAAGFFVFVDYFAKERDPGATPFLAILCWLALLVRLGWSVFKRTAVARRVAEARLFVRDRVPVPGRPFAVRVEQAPATPAARGTSIRALEARLVCEETILPRKGPSYAKVAWSETLVLGRDLLATADRAARGEGTIEVPGRVGGEGWPRWRVEVRTRLLGADYRTRFPLHAPDDED
jgi:hypothetical protein